MILLYIGGYGFLFSSGSGLALRSSQRAMLWYGCAVVKWRFFMPWINGLFLGRKFTENHGIFFSEMWWVFRKKKTLD